MKKSFLFLVILLASFQILSISLAQESKNFGILDNNIWYSKEEFFVDDTITIYSAIYNTDSEDIEGSIDFFDNEAFIGKSDFKVKKSEGLSQVKISWKVTEGSHKISARLNEAHLSGDFNAKVIAQNQKTGEDIFSVDFDTDKDGIGDLDDEDDDNDGLSDAQEEKLGTDPKNPDSDGDGLNDKQEQELKTNPLNADSDSDGLVDGKDLEPNKVSSQTAEIKQGEKPAINKEEAINQSKQLGSKIVSAVSQFADKQEQGLEGVKRKVKGQIQQIKSGQLEESKQKSVFLQSYLILLSILQFIYKVKWLFYLILILITFKVLAWMFRKLFRRRSLDLD